MSVIKQVVISVDFADSTMVQKRLLALFEPYLFVVNSISVEDLPAKSKYQ